MRGKARWLTVSTHRSTSFSLRPAFSFENSHPSPPLPPSLPLLPPLAYLATPQFYSHRLSAKTLTHGQQNHCHLRPKSAKQLGPATPPPVPETSTRAITKPVAAATAHPHHRRASLYKPISTKTLSKCREQVKNQATSLQPHLIKRLHNLYKPFSDAPPPPRQGLKPKLTFR